MKVDVFNKEYTYIKNIVYRDNLKILVNLLPDYFFLVPASSTGKYHPKFSLGKGGLVRHTKAAVKIANDLLYNESIGKPFTSNEKDLMIMALVLHDGLKHGLVKQEYTIFEHPLEVVKFIQNNKDKLTLKEEEIIFICNAIKAHMGNWNTNSYSDIILPIPEDKYQKFVHMCDYLASRRYLDIEFFNDDIVD